MKDQAPGFFSLLHLRRDLGIQLLTLYLLLVIPALTAILIFDAIAGRQIQAEVKASDLSVTRAIARETDQRLQSVLIAVENLGTYPAVIASDLQGMEAIFAIASSARRLCMVSSNRERMNSPRCQKPARQWALIDLRWYATAF